MSDLTNLNADEIANMRCRIVDLEKEVKHLCNWFESRLDSLEEDCPLDEQDVRLSRMWIAEAREKFGLKK
jgi:hypothetical protein